LRTTLHPPPDEYDRKPNGENQERRHSYDEPDAPILDNSLRVIAREKHCACEHAARKVNHANRAKDSCSS